MLTSNGWEEDGDEAEENVAAAHSERILIRLGILLLVKGLSSSGLAAR